MARSETKKRPGEVAQQLLEDASRALDLDSDEPRPQIDAAHRLFELSARARQRLQFTLNLLLTWTAASLSLSASATEAPDGADSAQVANAAPDDDGSASLVALDASMLASAANLIADSKDSVLAVRSVVDSA